MIQYLSAQNNKKVKNIFIVHGEDQARIKYAEHLADAGFTSSHIPNFKETIEI